MEFSIRGIGIIKEADIKMDGLTVIAGSNNSGKTTVGRALYAVTSAVEDLAEKQQTDQAAAVVERILKIIRPFDEWFGRYLYFVREGKEKNSFLAEIENFRYEFEGKKLNYYMDILFRLCKSVEDDSFIEILINDMKEIPSWKNIKAELLRSWKTNKDKMLKECKSASEFVESFQEHSRKEYACKLIEKTLQVEFSNQAQSFAVLEDRGISSLEFKTAENLFYKIDLSDNKVLEEKSSFDNGYFDRVYFVDDPYILEDPVDMFRYAQTIKDDSYIRSAVMHHRDKMRNIMRRGADEQGVSEEIFREKKLGNVMYRINQIVPGKFWSDFYQPPTGRKLKVENLATGSKVFSIIKKILTSGDLTDKTLLILDEPESHLHPSWINQLAEVIVLLVKECNMTVLLTTHSPNFLLAVDALMRKYEIREKCHFYQTEFEENNQIKYVEKTDCLDNIYADFAASFAEMNALRKKYMNLEE